MDKSGKLKRHFKKRLKKTDQFDTDKLEDQEICKVLKSNISPKINRLKPMGWWTENGNRLKRL